jgi:hypothetical protein
MAEQKEQPSEIEIREKFYWHCRGAGYGGSKWGQEVVDKHSEKEKPLAIRVLEVDDCEPRGMRWLNKGDGLGYDYVEETEPELYTLYEFTGKEWSSGEWSQKEFPRALIVVPQRQREHGAFERTFEHLGCSFKVCDHMSYTIFHLETRT